VYNSALSFSLVQPLMKGFAFDLAIPRADYLRAQFASRGAALAVRASLIAVLKATEDAYWDLLGALKGREVRRSSFELARQQQSLTEKQTAPGFRARATRTPAKSTRAQRELAMIEAEAGVTRAANRLREVLNLPPSEWTRPLFPGDPPLYEEPRVNLDEAMA